MLSPFEIMLSDSDVAVIPVKLTDTQQRQIDDFHERTGGRWIVEFVRVGVNPMWLVSTGENAIVDTTLPGVLQLAVRSQEGW